MCLSLSWLLAKISLTITLKCEFDSLWKDGCEKEKQKEKEGKKNEKEKQKEKEGMGKRNRNRKRV